MNCVHRKAAFKASVDLRLDEAFAWNDAIEGFNLKLTEICIRIKHYVSEFIWKHIIRISPMSLPRAQFHGRLNLLLARYEFQNNYSKLLLWLLVDMGQKLWAILWDVEWSITDHLSNILIFSTTSFSEFFLMFDWLKTNLLQQPKIRICLVLPMVPDFIYNKNCFTVFSIEWLIVGSWNI